MVIPVLLAALQVAPALLPPADTLRYDVTYHADGGEPRLEVELVFRGGPAGAVALVLPDGWANQRDLHRAIRGPVPADPAVRVLETGDPATRRVVHPPGSRVRIRYDVVQDWEGSPARETYFRPIVGPEWFHVLGHNTLVLPAAPEDRPFRVEVRWRLPAGAGVANSFGAGQRFQAFDATPAELRNAVFAGGTLDLRRLKTEAGPVWLAAAGQWTTPPDDLAALVAEVLPAVRRAWHSGPPDHYLVSFVPAPGERGGTRFTNAVALYVDPGARPDHELAVLLAHEAVHEWIGGRIRAPADEPEARGKWFTEGFTDYYAHRILWRAGVLPDTAYARALNGVLEEYHASPVRAAPADSVEARYWKVRDANRLPYLRGHLFALRLDRRIREATGGSRSLDAAIERLLAWAEHGGRLTDRTFAEAVAPYLGAAAALELERYIRQGHPIPPEPGAVGECFHLAEERIPAFDLGFDFAASVEAGRVTGVDSAGPAYRAGLRDGLPLRGYSIHHGDTDRDVKVAVEREGARVIVAYRPLAPESLTVPRYHPGGSCGS